MSNRNNANIFLRIETKLTIILLKNKFLKKRTQLFCIIFLLNNHCLHLFSILSNAVFILFHNCYIQLYIIIHNFIIVNIQYYFNYTLNAFKIL
jgi:hypothetical protein